MTKQKFADILFLLLWEPDRMKIKLTILKVWTLATGNGIVDSVKVGNKRLLPIFVP